jgi:tetratricopeptide (TPR) repeat protein
MSAKIALISKDQLNVVRLQEIFRHANVDARISGDNRLILTIDGIEITAAIDADKAYIALLVKLGDVKPGTARLQALELCNRINEELAFVSAYFLEGFFALMLAYYIDTRAGVTAEEVVDEARRFRAAIGSAPPVDTEHVLDTASFVERCLKQAFTEAEEARDWRSDPSFRSVRDPLNAGDLTTAAREAEMLAARFPDLDLAYDWWGSALMRRGELAEARKVCRRGLERSRRKFMLCRRLGEVSWEAGLLGDAVYWWAQAVHCLESLQEKRGESSPYLYLHYVAAAAGEPDVAAAFLQRADSVRLGMVRLDSKAAQSLTALASRGQTSDIREILVRLRARYLQPVGAPTAGDSGPDHATNENSGQAQKQQEISLGDGVAVLDKVYLVTNVDPALEEQIRAALGEVAMTEDGVHVLLRRLFESLSLTDGKVRVADYGDMTWNELLKLRMIIEALGRAPAASAVPQLSSLLTASCDYGQFNQIVRPAVAGALSQIGTAEAVRALTEALGRPDMPAETTVAIMTALEAAQPARPIIGKEASDISKRTTTGKIACIGFLSKNPATAKSLGANLTAITAPAVSTTTAIDGIFRYLEQECTIVRPYVYEKSFAKAWKRMNADIVLVADFEDKWEQFEKKMRSTSYSGDFALLRAFVLNAIALSLSVQFLSRNGDTIVTFASQFVNSRSGLPLGDKRVAAEMGKMDVQSTSRAPAANWYPDPSARHEFRYWDGRAWTHHVADRGQVSVDPITAPPGGTTAG